MPDIILKNLTARIDEERSLYNLNLVIKQGQQWAIIGPNGSGKTAFARLCCGGLKILSGNAALPERTEYVSFEKVTEVLDIERYNDDSNSRGGADPGTCAREFILAGNHSLLEELEQLAEKFAFTDLLDRGIKYLSTGEMRKAIVCRAVLQKPHVLILDEPFDGLDQESRGILKDLLNSLIVHGSNLILLLNRFSEILPQTTHLAYFNHCRIVTSGPKDQVLGSEALHKLHSFHKNLPNRLPAQPAPENDTAKVSPLPLIEMRQVEIRYGGKPVLNGLNWTVAPGEHWIISGPNGSGKTTLLNLISGDNTQAYANDIKLFGRSKGSGESIWEIKRHIGHISTAFQRSYRVRGTVLSVIISGFFDSIGVYRQYSREQLDIARQWLQILGMTQMEKAPFAELSFGEQRLVLLARAMIKHPRLLILDEPCQGLDEINREMVLKLIDYIGTNGVTQLLYVTHHPEDHVPCINRSLRLVPAPTGGSTARIEGC